MKAAGAEKFKAGAGTFGRRAFPERKLCASKDYPWLPVTSEYFLCFKNKFIAPDGFSLVGYMV